MKPIADLLKKQTSEQQIELAECLNTGHSEKHLLKALLCPIGIYKLLSTFTAEEKSIIQAVYFAHDGLTFGELGKNLNISIPEIEALTENLSHKLLIYITKNRQLLTNKLDKAYPVQEISPFIMLAENSIIFDKLKKMRLVLEHKKIDPKQAAMEENLQKLLFYITDNGGIVTFEQLLPIFPANELNAAIEKAITSDMLSIYYTLSPQFNSFIIINEKLLPSMVRETKNSIKYIHNGYRFILNMLYVYDSISSYGLFLTKQLVFRKIDFNRIVNSMILIKNRNNESIDKEAICKLALFFFSRLKALKLTKDTAKINITNLKEVLETPYILISKILQSLDSTKKDHELFAAPFETPPYKMTHLIIRLLHSMGETAIGYLKTTLLTSIINADKKILAETLLDIEKRKVEIEAGLDLLCMLGIICINDGKYALSDIGYDTAQYLFKLKPIEYNYEKEIYINPDFSLMMPLKELSSICAYSVLSWCEIVKDDVILNAQINRSSIITAQKRGFSLEPFMQNLKECSKNEIPQNMEFQLNEWSKQTLKITIDNFIILKTNHATFFDEIMYAKDINNNIEIINPNYAIINRKHIDDIVKLATKRNAVISLFEQIEEEE